MTVFYTSVLNLSCSEPHQCSCPASHRQRKGPKVVSILILNCPRSQIVGRLPTSARGSKLRAIGSDYLFPYLVKPEKTDEFRVGIVGCGMIANFHAKAIADAGNAHLVGCFNRSTDKANAFASEHGGKVYETLEEMISDPDVHALSICTPSGAHLDPAVAGAQAGKHIRLRNPQKSLRNVVTPLSMLAGRQGALAVTFQSRFHESSRLMKRAIDGGRFGKVTMGDADEVV